MKINTKPLLLLLGACAYATSNIACTDNSDHVHDHGDHSHGDHYHGEGMHEDNGDGHDHRKDEHDHTEHDHMHGDHSHSHGDHDHDHPHTQEGPNGGRLITSVKPYLEFLVLEDRRVKILQVKDGKVVPVGTQVISLIGGDRAKPTRMNFEFDGDALISDNAFPEGNSFPVVLQIKTSAGADAVTEKFNIEIK